MTQIFTINYQGLVAVCNQLQLKDAERTKSYLDVIQHNIANSNLVATYSNIIPVEINYDTMNISLLGDAFPIDFVTLCSTKNYEEGLIQLFIDAMELADELNCFDEVFKMITPKC